MSFNAAFWHQIGISWPALVGVIVATTVIYLSVTLIIRFTGQRLYANHTSSGLAVTLVFGSLSARAMLGNAPTLMGWVTALVTIFVLERFIGLRYQLGWKRKPRTAVVIYQDGHFYDDKLKAYHLPRAQVISTLREKGIHQMSDISALLLEPTGNISIIRNDLDEFLRQGTDME